jgi:uncharacterized repeat protein (TIGR01451 family)
MRRRSICLIKCLIGLAVAFIAVSNCFNVMSNSSTSPASPPDQTRSSASNANKSKAGLGPIASAAQDRRTLDSTGFNHVAGMASLATKASALSPFAPAVTATKSHTPAGSANPGDTLTYTVVIGNSGTSDATGVNFSDTIDPNTTLVPGSVKASPIAADDSYHTIGNVNISVPVAQGVTANDSNSGVGTLSVTKVNATVVPGGGSATTSTANGSVTMNSDGSFAYSPNVAFRGPSDSFTYTLDNGSGSTDTATVTISVTGLIWFVNAGAGSGGDGRLGSPFNCLVGAGCFDPAAADIANDNIFVYSGSYTGGMTLLNGQRLIGQGAGDTLLNITGLAAPSGTNLLPSTGGTSPVIAAAGSDVTLGSGNTIRGVTLNGTAAAAIDLTGTGFGTLTLADTALGGTGQALNLTNGTLTGPIAATAAFASISSTNSSTSGVSLTSVSGNMSSGSTSITNPTGIGITVSTSSAALNFGNTTSTLSGGTGVSLTSNTGTITFGTLDISPDSGQRGMLATENTNTITSTGGAVSTTGATAVEITRSSSTTPLVMSLTSISANGGANGIKLLRTSGSFTVTGDGASDPANTTRGRTTAKNGGGTITLGSGGTINNTTGAAVSLNTTTNVTLRNLSLTGNGGGVSSGADGINAASSSSLTLDNVLVTGHLGNDGLSGGAVSGLTLQHTDVHTNATTAGTESLDIWNVRLDNLTGTSAISNSLFFDSREDIFFITNAGSSNLTLTLTNSEFRDTQVAAGNVTFGILANGSAVTNVTATGSKFANARTTGFQYAGNNTSGGTVNVRSSVFDQNGVDVDIAHQGAGTTLNYEVSGNTMRQTFKANSSTSTNIFLGGLSTATSLMNGTVKNNVIGNAVVANSGSDLGAGIAINATGAGTVIASVTGNTVTQVRGSSGSVFVGALLDTAKLSLFIHNNTFSGNPAEPFGFASLEMDNGSGSPGENGTLCIDMAANIVTMSASSFASVYFPSFSGTTNVVGYTGAVNDETQLQNFFGDSPGTTPPGVNTLTSPSPAVFVIGGTVQGSANCGIVFPTSAGPELSVQRVGPASDSNTDSANQSDNVLRSTWGKAVSADGVPELSQEELNWMVQAALVRWQQTGISAEELARLSAVRFEVADLADGRLAAYSPTNIRIDRTGAAYGWFYDSSPWEDSEFDVPVSGKELQTTELSPAHGKMDLLTVVMRELGSVYLQGKNRIPKNLRPLMESTLSPAVRRMPIFNVPDRSTSSIRPGADQPLNTQTLATGPSPAQNSGVAAIPAVFHPTAELMPGSYGGNAKHMSYASSARSVAPVSPFSGETVNLNVGTIPPGKSVTIMFQVTINNPLPNGVCSVTNQGHVTGTNFSQVDTNTDVTPIAKAVTIGACPANITTNTDPGVCTAVVTYTAPTGDGCPTPTVTCNRPSGFAFPKGTTTVTCTATNGNPPDATCSFTVTVNDNQPPAITCPANVTQGTDPGQCSAAVTYSNATATDNCSGVGTPVCTPASGSTFAKGTTTVNCTVSDASGNSAACSFTVTVNDTTPPTITCPASVTQSTDPNQCSAVVTYTNATATDNCPGVGTPVCTPGSGTTFAKGTTTVNCTVSDASGNPASCSFTVTINDTQAPSITCPSSVTQGTDANHCSAVVTYSNANATDNCPGVGTPVCTPASGTTFAKGTTTVNCTVSDASGNSASCSFTVTINDTQPPSITCPSNVIQGTDPNQCSAVVTYSNATATDNCPGVGTPVCTPPSGSTFPKGVTTVTCTVSDASANTATCSFTVTINDTTPPTISCPANVTKSTDPNVCTAVVTYPNATAGDNCSGVGTPVCTPSSGSTFNKGTTTVTCTVSDSSGNSANCSFTVTVKDTQAPNLGPCPSNISVTSGGGCQVVTYTPPTATDNCGSAAVNCSPASGTCFPPGTTTVTCTASDDSPDSPDSSCSFTVTVVPCTITCPNNIVRGNDPGQCGAIVTYAPTTGGGGCGTVTCSPPSGSFFPVGTTPVNCGTQAGPSCGFTVTIKDTEPPTMTPCPPNVSVTTSGACQVVTYTKPTATDNCGSATVNCSPPSGTCFPVGTTTVTCTASDNSPDSPDTTCSFTVTVIPCSNLTALSPGKVWIGLKSSDDEGTNIDLLAEVLKNGSVIGSGQLNNVSSGSGGFNNAILRAITLGLNSATSICPGDTLSFRLSVRVNNAGSSTITVRLWYNGAFIDTGASRDAGSRFDATIGGSNSNYFLRSPGFTLNTTAGSSRTFVDKLTSNSGGNPWVAFGTWSKTF